MGCCGCTLYVSTVTAGILTLLDCVLYLTFDILVIVFLSLHGNWKVDSKSFQDFLDGFKDFEDSTTVIILIGIKVGLRIVWLISGILLLIGNAREFRKFINVWKYLTVGRIVYTIGTSIYGLVSLIKHIKILFDGKHDWDKYYSSVSKFVVLLDFLELGPIWLIILIALAIYVHQRSLEIDSKKRQNTNLWTNSGTNGSHYGNGGVRNSGTSPLAHPVSLTQEPNPFTMPKENPAENNNNQANSRHKPEINEQPMSTLDASALSKTNDLALKPILEINGVISIPRVTLNHQNKPIATEFDSHHKNKRYVSSLAKRPNSYLDFERDPNNVPKRSHSYNMAQNSGQRPFSYENRAFDSKTEKDIYTPVLIKRASTRRTQNH